MSHHLCMVLSNNQSSTIEEVVKRHFDKTEEESLFTGSRGKYLLLEILNTNTGSLYLLQVFVVSGGIIAERGTHTQLLHKGNTLTVISACSSSFTINSGNVCFARGCDTTSKHSTSTTSATNSVYYASASHASMYVSLRSLQIRLSAASCGDCVSWKVVSLQSWLCLCGERRWDVCQPGATAAGGRHLCGRPLVGSVSLCCR